MARSTETKRAAARSKEPAKRPAAGRGTGAAARGRSPRPERPAPPAPVLAEAVAAAEVLAPGNAPATTQDRVGERAPAPPPEPAATVPTVALVTGNAAEPDASPVEPAAPSGPGPEQEPDAAAAGTEGVLAAATDAAPAPEPAPTAEDRNAAAAAPSPGRNLVEGTMGLHEQMVAFACRQAEFGLSASRAMLASRSLPEILSLQSAFVGRSVENALAHTLELTRLSAGILRGGLRSDDPR
jgi:Phasin protein